MTIARLILTTSLMFAGCSKDPSPEAAKATTATIPATPTTVATPTTAATPTTPPAPAVASADRFEIKVTEKGFEPDDVKVPAGKPVTLVFERMTDDTCAKEVVLALADGSKIEKDLPLGKPVEIATTFPTAGRLTYACGMNMMKGTLTVQ